MTNLVTIGPLQAPSTPVHIAKRPFLPGSDHLSMPATLSQPATDTFPLVLRPKLDTSKAEISLDEWAADVRSWIETVLHEHGAILVRNLPIANADALARFISYLGFDTMGYESGTAVRHEVAANVMTASNDPSEFSIEPHSEMSYARVYPSKLLLFCDIPPSIGGETPIVDVRYFMQQLDPAVREAVIRTGIQYIRYLPSRSDATYASWQSTFLTEDKQVVERYCRAHRYDYKWDANDNFTYRYVLPATVTHLITGDDLWFNQIPSHHASYFKAHPAYIGADHEDDHYPFHCRDGEGRAFSDEVVAHVRQVEWRCAVAIPWQRGDLLILDNLLAQHARMSFVGARNILVTLLK